MKLTATITITRAGTEVDVPVVGHFSPGEAASWWGPHTDGTIEIESIGGEPLRYWQAEGDDYSTIAAHEAALDALWDAAADRLETERAQEEDADEARRERFLEEA